MRRTLALAAALLATSTAPAAAATIYAADGSNRLVTMDSVTPSAGQTATPITGLQAGEAVVSLDVRPAGGDLYGVAVNGTSGRLYRIDPQTAAATAVGTGAFSNALGSAVTGFNFNPTVDR